MRIVSVVVNVGEELLRLTVDTARAVLLANMLARASQLPFW